MSSDAEAVLLPTSTPGGESCLIGRDRELAVLIDLVDRVADESAAILILGDPGIGKSSLLRAAVEHAARSGLRVMSITGVEAEADLAFAGLHQLLRPVLATAGRLPVPQRDALLAAFGTAPEGPADRRAPEWFMIALATLNILTDEAAERPLIVAIDDAQWLDKASVEVLGFVARRLYADHVGMVFTVRKGEGHATALAGLPELVVGGLPDDAACQLLAASAGTPVDGRVSAQVVAGVAGNPLALVELAGELTAEELSGAMPMGWPLRFGGRLEEMYLARVRALPADTRMLLLLAAADPTGDPALVYKAAGQLGAGPETGEAPDTGLVSWRTQVRFRHPLIRSAAYYAASAEQRRRAHAALAAVTDADADPDRRAWHLAEATVGPDEEVAAELERSAGRAQARGGLAAAAAFLERSLLVTADPARHADRILMTAQVSTQAGALGRALELLATAEAGGAGPLDEFQRARVDLLRGRIAYASNMGSDALSLLLKAARRLEPLNLDLARQTYLTAWSAAMMAGHLAGADNLLEVSRAARALPPPADPPRPVDLILDGMTRLVTDGPTAAVPVLRQAVDIFAAEGPATEEGLRWAALAATVALWDDEAGHTITARQVRLNHAAGALEWLPSDLVTLASLDARRGDFAVAASLVAESDAAIEATGTRIAPFVRMLLAALRGDEAEFTPLMAASIATAAEGQGLAATTAGWYAGLLYNGLGRYDEAFAAAGEAREHSHLLNAMWGLPELIEAAARTGHTQAAAGALADLAATTQAAGTDYGLGIEARSRALLSDSETAETLYQEAIDRLGRTRLRPELARAHLLYGEWLRRQRRRRDARDQLRTAFEMFDSIGMEAFAARARTELRATGERARPRTTQAPEVLTPQEEQIARLVTEHLSNREIAARLFISVSTVEYHLRKIFRKLGVSSRAEVARSSATARGHPG
ncbi:MAG TPA: AAA family ATPase [Trebonia sp.]